VPDTPRLSPGSTLESLRGALEALAAHDARRVGLVAEVDRLTADLLPCLADGATLNVALGYNPVRSYLRVSRAGDAVTVEPLDVVHHFDLEWPSPGTAEAAEFGPRAVFGEDLRETDRAAVLPLLTKAEYDDLCCQVQDAMNRGTITVRKARETILDASRRVIGFPELLAEMPAPPEHTPVSAESIAASLILVDADSA
jgi:hypothetical protein